MNPTGIIFKLGSSFDTSLITCSEDMPHDDLRYLIWLYISPLQDILNDYRSQIRRCHTAQCPIEGPLKDTYVILIIKNFTFTVFITLSYTMLKTCNS